MTGEAIICRLTNIHPIEDADRIVQARVLGETVVIGKDHIEGELGVMFDCETQLSHEFCVQNNLYRAKYGYNKDPEEEGFFEEKRRVRALRLRGVKCSAFWMPIDSLSAFGDITTLKEGTQFKEFNGHEICDKYVPPSTSSARTANRVRKTKIDLCPAFKQHVDTDHLMRNMNMIRSGDHVVVTLKLHGTSGRCGNLPIVKRNPWYMRLLGHKTRSEYGFVVGSRRVTKAVEGEELGGKDHFYDVDIWTLSAEETFKGKLRRGETAYYEIVGRLPNGTYIHPSHPTKKLKNTLFKGDKDGYKDFADRYGEYVHVHYGHTDNYGVYVYRITITNDDGQQIDLPWDQVKQRCEDMGVPYVPEIRKGYLVTNLAGDLMFRDLPDWSSTTFEGFIEGETNTPVCDFFPNTVREGVVVRVDNGNPNPIFLKHKSFAHKYLEGILKDNDEFVDIEESQG